MRALACTLLFVFVCGQGSGGSTNVKVEAETATTGTHLRDLDQAYRDGIIDRQEYEKAKKRIIEGK